MRRAIIAVALAGALWSGWALPIAAQSNGLVIENNGVDSVDSAAGADNVRISRNPGNSSSTNAAGTGNEERRANRDRKERRANRDNAAAPVEAAPVQDDLQAYGGDTGYTAPAPAEPEVAPAPVAAAQVTQLPSTGSGDSALPWAALVALFSAIILSGGSLRQRLLR